MWRSLLLITVLTCAVHAEVGGKSKEDDFAESQKRNLEKIKNFNRHDVHHPEPWNSFMAMTRQRETEMLDALKKKLDTLPPGDERERVALEIRMLEKRLERFNHPDMFKNPSRRSDGKKEFHGKLWEEAPKKAPVE